MAGALEKLDPRGELPPVPDLDPTPDLDVVPATVEGETPEQLEDEKLQDLDSRLVAKAREEHAEWFSQDGAWGWPSQAEPSPSE